MSGKSVFIIIFILLIVFCQFSADKALANKYFNTWVTSDYRLGETINASFVDSPGFFRGGLNGIMVVPQSIISTWSWFWDGFGSGESADYTEENKRSDEKRGFFASLFSFIWGVVKLLFNLVLAILLVLFAFLWYLLYWSFQVYRFGDSFLYYVGLTLSLFVQFLLFIGIMNSNSNDSSASNETTSNETPAPPARKLPPPLPSRKNS